MSDYLRFWQVKESIFLRDLPDGSLFQTFNVRAVIPRLLHFAKENFPSVILLTGETGIGKTSFLRWLYFHLNAETHDVWYVPLLSLELQKGWLIKKLARFLGVTEKGPLRLEDLLGKTAKKLDQLVVEKRRLLVMIDDAHLIAKEEALADLAAFLNIQSMGARCLSFVVSGAGNLDTQLARNQCVLSRVVMRYQFKAFSLEETMGYLAFRFQLAGIPNVFSKEASVEIHHLARGVPGLINILAENSLFDGFQKKCSMIEASQVREARQYLTGYGVDSPNEGSTDTKDFDALSLAGRSSFPEIVASLTPQRTLSKEEKQDETKEGPSFKPVSSGSALKKEEVAEEEDSPPIPDLARAFDKTSSEKIPWDLASEETLATTPQPQEDLEVSWGPSEDLSPTPAFSPQPFSGPQEFTGPDDSTISEEISKGWADLPWKAVEEESALPPAPQDTLPPDLDSPPSANPHPGEEPPDLDVNSLPVDPGDSSSSSGPSELQNTDDLRSAHPIQPVRDGGTVSTPATWGSLLANLAQLGELSFKPRFNNKASQELGNKVDPQGVRNDRALHSIEQAVHDGELGGPKPQHGTSVDGETSQEGALLVSQRGEKIEDRRQKQDPPNESSSLGTSPKTPAKEPPISLSSLFISDSKPSKT